MKSNLRELIEYALEVYWLQAKHGRPSKTFEECLREGYYVLTGDRASGAILPDGMRDRRKALRMTQNQLADETGLSRNYIGLLERDADARESVSLKAAAAIARSLHASVDQIFEVAAEAQP